jgi:NurA-like 5'-3' nuclease
MNQENLNFLAKCFKAEIISKREIVPIEIERQNPLTICNLGSIKCKYKKYDMKKLSENFLKNLRTHIKINSFMDSHNIKVAHDNSFMVENVKFNNGVEILFLHSIPLKHIFIWGQVE